MERLKWQVLRAFHALPTEPRVQAMLDRDYVWCAAHMILDEEAALETLCPQCRTRAPQSLCPICGQAALPAGDSNPNFDLTRFEAMRRGGTP